MVRSDGSGCRTYVVDVPCPTSVVKVIGMEGADMNPALMAIARSVPGFMPEDEGLALFAAGRDAAAAGPLLEIGSYRGRSAVYLGAAAQQRGTVLFSIDHHRGSEEHQPGEEYHEPEVLDAQGRVDSLPSFRATIAAAELEATVIAVVGPSELIARYWSTPLGLVFIDGGHAEATARADLAAWGPLVAPGGLLAIHDVFPDPRDGGRPPYLIYEAALRSGEFAERSACGSLRILERILEGGVGDRAAGEGGRSEERGRGPFSI